MRSFGSSSIVGSSEKSSAIRKSFESYSELVSSSLEMKVLKKKFLGNNKKSLQTYSLQVGVLITILVIHKSLLRIYKILILILIQALPFWMTERRNQCNHNLHLLQSNISTNFYNY